MNLSAQTQICEKYPRMNFSFQSLWHLTCSLYFPGISPPSLRFTPQEWNRWGLECGNFWNKCPCRAIKGFPSGSVSKESAYNAADIFFFLVFLENSSLRALPESYLVKNTSHVPKYAEWSEELICTAEGIFFFLQRLLVAAQRIFTVSYETVIVVKGL